MKTVLWPQLIGLKTIEGPTKHTVKNAIITHEQTIEYLSPTVPGREADITVAQPVAQVDWPNKSMLVTDTGFQGLPVPPSSQLVQPYKKPKKCKLSTSERAWNRLVATVRVPVEHVLAGVKRGYSVSAVCRHIKEELKDLVMLLAVGLHNFRVAHRMKMVPAMVPSG